MGCMECAASTDIKIGSIYLSILLIGNVINIRGFSSLQKKSIDLVYDALYDDFSLPLDIMR